MPCFECESKQQQQNILLAIPELFGNSSSSPGVVRQRFSFAKTIRASKSAT